MFRKARDGAGIARTLNYQGDVARERVDFDAARSFCEQSLAAVRQLRDGWGIASALSDLATLSCDQRNDRDNDQNRSQIEYQYAYNDGKRQT